MHIKDSTIGQYEILEQIGQGGMGAVYKGYQSALDRYVAIKILTADVTKRPEFIARFEREAKSIAKLRHRNILTIFDYGRQDDILYLVMEYVQRGTLQQRLGWPQDLGYSVNIISQVGDALAYAHQQGIVHRDIKPANILVAEENWFLLSDFGLVKTAEESQQLTMSGTSVGTPYYMSPEQAQGQPVDGRSDIYALGTLLYEAVTGQTPFGLDNPLTVLMKKVVDPITPPRQLRSDLPEEMEQVIMQALERSPEDRYQRMEEFVIAVRNAHAQSDPDIVAHPFMNALPPAQPISDFNTQSIHTPMMAPTVTPSQVKPVKKKRRGLPWARLALSLVLLILIGLTALLVWSTSAPFATALMEDISETLEAPNLAPSVEPVAEDSAAEFTSPTATPTEMPDITQPTMSDLTPTPVSLKVSPGTPEIEIRLEELAGGPMAFVPEGPFTMGSDTLGEDEQPVRQVYLDAYWLDQYEVTNAQFADFVQAEDYQTTAEQQGWGWVLEDEALQEATGATWQHPHGPESDIADKMDHPVVLVSWADAMAYCTWAGKRLPTEAEWEKAARGPDLAGENAFAWGASFDSQKANTSEFGEQDTLPVGSFSPAGDAPYGVADMTGNVGEWVADWYSAGYYSRSSSDNPLGPTEGSEKILRGGSWFFEALYAQTAFRYNINPEYTYNFAGFRCAMSDVGN